KYKGRPIGSGANPVAFSFYATKNLTTAEGGMLTGDAAFLERARTLSLHGMSRDAWTRYDRGGSWFYEVVAPGFQYNMTDIQPAPAWATAGPAIGRRSRRCDRRAWVTGRWSCRRPPPRAGASWAAPAPSPPEGGTRSRPWSRVRGSRSATGRAASGRPSTSAG